MIRRVPEYGYTSLIKENPVSIMDNAMPPRDPDEDDDDYDDEEDPAEEPPIVREPDED